MAAPPTSPREVERILLAPGALARKLNPEAYRLLHAALFGAARGPSLSDLVAYFTRERIEDALRAYVRDGSRPLREDVLASIRSARETSPAHAEG